MLETTPSFSRRYVALAIALGLAAAGALAACATQNSRTSESKAETAPAGAFDPQLVAAPAGGDTLTHLEPQFFNTLYPPAAGFYPNGSVVNNITDRLLYQDPDTLELSPWIATELPEINSDATEYTFTIRTDVTYSDGSPLTAQNVVDNFDLFGRGDADRNLTVSEQIANYSHGEVLADNKVRFFFTAPSPGFAQATSSFNAGLVSDRTLEFDNEGFSPGNAVNVIGSGPFVITQEDLGTALTLSAREDYHWAPPAASHQGRARLDHVRIVLAQEQSVRVGGLTSGQADVALQIAAPEEPLLAERGIGIVAEGTKGVNNQLAFRFRHQLLSDQRVREAIIAAIDREEVLATLFSESYPLADSALARDALGHKAQPQSAYRFDPERARELFDAAGWRPGPDGILEKDGQRMELTVNEALPQPRSREVITKIQEQLRKVGVALHLNPGDQATQNADRLNQDKIQIVHTMVGRADFDVIESQYHSQARNQLLNGDSTTETLGDEHLEELLEKVASTPDTAGARPPRPRYRIG